MFCSQQKRPCGCTRGRGATLLPHGVGEHKKNGAPTGGYKKKKGRGGGGKKPYLFNPQTGGGTMLGMKIPTAADVKKHRGGKKNMRRERDSPTAQKDVVGGDKLTYKWGRQQKKERGAPQGQE